VSTARNDDLVDVYAVDEQLFSTTPALAASVAVAAKIELTRSPIAEHGWFVTVTDIHGGSITGWIGKNHRCTFDADRPVRRDLRRAVQRVARALDRTG
jgi:hypothetical protein